MASTVIEWFPAAETAPTISLTTGPLAPYRLMQADGLEAVEATPVSIKSPNQPGETAVDVVLPPRVISLGGLMQAMTAAEIWDLRAALMRAMAQQPTRLGETIELGRLRVTLQDRQPLEVLAVPRKVSVDRPKGVKSIAPFDLEFLAPHPYWKEVADSQLVFSGTGGGMTFSATWPITITSNNIQTEIVNLGDVDTPILVRFYGDITTARIRNLTTGEELEITGNVPATQYIEVDTAFGNKKVELVTISTGARASAMNRINLSKPDFWLLRPGSNLVRFEADTNLSGRAEVYWREQYSGI